jgi:hypothetical protein
VIVRAPDPGNGPVAVFLACTARLDQRIKTVVNIGIGGSDLGPVMSYRALRRYADGGISSMRAASVGPVQSVDLTRRNVPPLIILCHRLVNTVAWIPGENASGAMVVRLSSARTDALLFVKSAVLGAISLPQRE